MIWRDVKGYEGLYQVNKRGDIMNLVKGKIEEINKRFGRYSIVYMKGHDGKYRSERVAKIVANAFIPSVPGKSMINHKDLNKCNDRAENLEWVTHIENIRHSRDSRSSFRNKAGKLDVVTYKILSRYYGIDVGSAAVIMRIKTLALKKAIKNR